MPIREARVLQLIEGLYDSAGDASRWVAFLELLMGTVHARAAHFTIEGLRSQGSQVGEFVGSDMRYVRSYGEHYGRLNAWVAHGARHFQTGNVVHSELLIPESTLRKTEFYNDFLQPQGYHWVLGAVIFKEDDAAVDLAALRSANKGPFEADEIRLFKRLMPHLQRAVRLHRRLSAAEVKGEALLGATDRFPHGVLLVAQTGEVLEANRAARALLDRSDGITLDRRGRLTTDSAGSRAELRDAIDRAIRAGPTGGTGQLDCCRVERASTAGPLQVVVFPFRSAADVLARQRVSAIVFVHDPDTRVELGEQALQRVFGLSRAEARLADRLAAGDSLVVAGKELDVSLNTVRTHLKRIFEKTGTRRQAELVRRLVLSAAAKPG